MSAGQVQHVLMMNVVHVVAVGGHHLDVCRRCIAAAVRWPTARLTGAMAAVLTAVGTAAGAATAVIATVVDGGGGGGS